MFKEVIVVEGKDDLQVVKGAVKAEVITTSGLGMPPETMERIRAAHERCGIIILTDPDPAGDKIRRRLAQEFPGCKHAFLFPEEGSREGKIGVEYASPQAIQRALAAAKAERRDGPPLFTFQDLVEGKLVGCPGAERRREALGRVLGLGPGNAKQFLRRLNGFAISRQEWDQAMERVREETSGQ